MSANLRRYPDVLAAANACGEQILAWLDEVIRLRGEATLAISGGTSPKPMFELFARTPFDWTRVQLYWVDERCVLPDHPQSNFKLANDAWLTPARFPEANIHRVQTELDPADAARRYAAGIPPFDVIHRGIGPDAHTASLFPGEPMILNRDDTVAAVWVEKFQQWRVTLLPVVLEAARHTAILVAGADKAQALASALTEPYDPLKYPAQLASRDGSTAVWFVDDAAAAQLE